MMKEIDIKEIKIKRSSDSSSEMSIDNNSEQESNSFIIQKRKKNKRINTKMPNFIETSPNMRFSRQEEKKYSDKHLVSYSGIDHDRGCDVIWNVIDISKLTEEQQDKLYSEFSKMKILRHENINTISEVWLKDGNLVFITDSFFGGSIRQCLYKIGIQKLKVIKSWLKMILLGLDYLHKNGIIYSDLNCGRIYYNNNNGNVSIGDLFVATPIYYKFFNEKEYEIFTPNCMSPEILLEKSVSEKSDVYSLGMVLIEIITIEIPYSDFNMSRLNIIQKIRDGVEPSLLDRISDLKAKEFIRKMIDPDPDKRPTIKNILDDEFLIINEKEDNRKIKLIKIKKKKKKKRKSSIDVRESLSLHCKNKSKKNIVPFKRDFEENPYFEETLKNEKLINNSQDANLKANNLDLKTDIAKTRRKTISKEKSPRNKVEFKDQKDFQLVQVTSSHEGPSKCCSDVYHTANTDYFNQMSRAQCKTNPLGFKTVKTNPIILKTNTDESIDRVKKSEKSEKSENILKKAKENSKHSSHHNPPYQIFDDHYNVLLKFLISQDGKLHEIQFTYNLLRDNIPDLMEEIQNEFNFSQDNLNHIYETLKKISIYSKFYKQSDILHDNSV